MHQLHKLKQFFWFQTSFFFSSEFAVQEDPYKVCLKIFGDDERGRLECQYEKLKTTNNQCR